VAWQRPDQFRKVISFSGSFADLRGGQVYPDLVRREDRKAIRVFQHVGANDIVFEGSPPWLEANNRLAAALDERHYDHKFVLDQGTHCRAQAYIREGKRWVVDLDLEKFFDRVNHDVLMARVARQVSDARVLKLIRRFLESGMMQYGLVEPRTEGTPQGGPLSPLLSNILLTDLDRELERRGLASCRYADDCAPRRREGVFMN
jgi:Reverse transcriptase (RNA-dependent DNA polymerase)